MALVTSPDADENNCPYINFAGNSRNCHMIFDSDFDEDSYYSNVLKHSRNCVDCSYVHRSELCYECIDCNNCYALSYAQDCTSCSDSAFLFSCIGCTNCLFCVNMTHKEFHIFNRPCTREEYERTLSTLRLDTRAGVERARARFTAHLQEFPRRCVRMLRTENCVGDYVFDSKNAYRSFNIAEAEDVRYCDSLYRAKNCMDVSSFGENIDHVYESGTIGINASFIAFSFVCVLNCSDLLYCMEMRQSQQCFGCASMKRAKYCILNRQYTAAEYAALVPKIVEHMRRTGEWGEFFPMELSPFGYNETMAQEMFPLGPDAARVVGANWSVYEPPLAGVSSIGPEAVPDSIADARDDIVNTAIRCADTGRPFRLAAAELSTYRRRGIPIPVLHPDARYRRRMAQRNPQILRNARCAATGEAILTTYPDSEAHEIFSETAFAGALQ